MKITYMRLREDFDKINKDTLNSIYCDSNEKTDLFIPNLEKIGLLKEFLTNIIRK